MEKQRTHRRRRRKRRRLGRLYFVFAALLAAAAIAAGCIVFFRVSAVEVCIRTSDGAVEPLAEDDRYTQEEILEAAGVQIGDNLFLLNKNRTAGRLLGQLAYVSGVSIQKKLPGTLSLTLTESTAAAAIQTGEKEWWLIDLNGKLLEQTDSAGNHAVIHGLSLIDPAVGQEISVPDGSEVPDSSGSSAAGERQTLQKDSLIQLLTPLQDYDLLKDVKSIDLTSDSDLTLDYQGRLRVVIPLEADFAEKIKYFSKILTEYVAVNWTEADTGTLDMTYGDGHPHLVKDS